MGKYTKHKSIDNGNTQKSFHNISKHKGRFWSIMWGKRGHILARCGPDTSRNKAIYSPDTDNKLGILPSMHFRL